MKLIHMLHFFFYILGLMVLASASATQDQNTIELKTFVEVAKANFYKISQDTKPAKTGSISKLNPTEIYNINDKVIWNKNLIRPFEYSITISDENTSSDGFTLIEMRDKKDKIRLYARKENNEQNNWQLYYCPQNETESKPVTEITDIDAFISQKKKFKTTEKSLSKSDGYKKKQFAFSKSCDTLIGKLRPLYIELVKIEKRYVLQSEKAKLDPSYSCAKTTFEYIDSLLQARAKYHVTSMNCLNHESSIKVFEIERLNKLFELLKAKISKASASSGKDDLDNVNQIYTRLSGLNDDFKDLYVLENQLRNFIITSRSKYGEAPAFNDIFDEEEKIYQEAGKDFSPILEEYKKLVSIRSKRVYDKLFTIDTLTDNDALKSLFLIRKYYLSLRYIDYSECLKRKSNSLDIGYFADSYDFKNLITRELVEDLEDEIKLIQNRSDKAKSEQPTAKKSTENREDLINNYEKCLKDTLNLIKKHELLFTGSSVAKAVESQNEPTSSEIQTEETAVPTPMTSEERPSENKGQEEQKAETPVVEAETKMEPSENTKNDNGPNGLWYYTKLSVVVTLVILVLCVVGFLVYTYTTK